METMIIELKNQHTTNLILELEQMQLLKILERQESRIPEQQLSEKYRGKLSSVEAADLNAHVAQMRSEWSSI